MGIDVHWKTELGEMLGELPDSDFRLSDLSALFYQQEGSCVRYIDPAGDACFNQLQLPDLISELRQVRNKVTDTSQIARLDELIALISQAHGTTHSYIWFIGD